MNLTQMENAATYREHLALGEMLDSMDELFKARHREDVNITYKVKLLNLFDERYGGTEAELSDRHTKIIKRITAAKERRAEIQRKICAAIVETAELLAVEGKSND